MRQALERVVEVGSTETEVEPKLPLSERLNRLREKYNMPPYESLKPFDEKAFLEDMWGENDVHR